MVEAEEEGLGLGEVLPPPPPAPGLFRSGYLEEEDLVVAIDEEVEVELVFCS